MLGRPSHFTVCVLWGKGGGTVLGAGSLITSVVVINPRQQLTYTGIGLHFSVSRFLFKLYLLRFSSSFPQSHRGPRNWSGSDLVLCYCLPTLIQAQIFFHHLSFLTSCLIEVQLARHSHTTLQGLRINSAPPISCWASTTVKQCKTLGFQDGLTKGNLWPGHMTQPCLLWQEKWSWHFSGLQNEMNTVALVKRTVLDSLLGFQLARCISLHAFRYKCNS